MPWDMLTKIADQLGAVNFSGRISPFLINEPLLDDRMPDIIQLFRMMVPRAFLSIVTNGNRLDLDTIERLDKAGIDSIGVSVYSDSKIEVIDHPKVCYMDKRDPGAFAENRGWKNLDKPAPELSKPCDRPGNMLPIRHNGDVILCCADVHGDHVFGNVGSQHIGEILATAEFKGVVKKLSAGDRRATELCSGCDYNGRTSPVSYPSRSTTLVKPEDLKKRRRKKSARKGA